jgi:hypothetical protein
VVVSGIEAPKERPEPRPAAAPVVDSGVQTRLDLEGQAVRELGARLLGTSLKGRRVLLVTTPGVGAATLATTTEVLTTAGARVSGTMALTAEYGVAARANELENLAVSLVAPATTLPRTRTPTTVTAAVISRALVADRERAAGDAAEAAAALLAGLDDAGFATTTGQAQQGATLAVVLVGTKQSPEATRAVVDLAAALDARGAGAVLAGLALVEQIGGRSGDYGRADGASATLPGKR